MRRKIVNLYKSKQADLNVCLCVKTCVCVCGVRLCVCVCVGGGGGWMGVLFFFSFVPAAQACMKRTRLNVRPQDMT